MARPRPRPRAAEKKVQTIEDSTDRSAQAQAHLKRKASHDLDNNNSQGSGQTTDSSNKATRSSYPEGLREKLGASLAKRHKGDANFGFFLDSTKLSAIYETLAKLNKDVAQLNKTAVLTHRMVEAPDDLAASTQADEIVEKLDDLDCKIDAVDANISTETAELATFEQVQSVEESLSGLDDKIGEVEEKVGEVDDNIQQALDEKSSSIMNNQCIIWDRINDVESGLESRLAELERKITVATHCCVTHQTKWVGARFDQIEVMLRTLAEKPPVVIQHV